MKTLITMIITLSLLSSQMVANLDTDKMQSEFDNSYSQINELYEEVDFNDLDNKVSGANDIWIEFTGVDFIQPLKDSLSEVFNDINSSEEVFRETQNIDFEEMVKGE